MCEQRVERLPDLAAEREQKGTRGPLESVYRIHPASELSAEQLHGGAPFVGVDRSPMHQQPGGFVDRDHVVVPVEDQEHVTIVRGEAVAGK